MQTRRDQLHAYRFMTRRAMSSLVTGEPDSVDPPMRRLTVFTISGIMVAIVIAVAFAVIGLIRPGGGDDWKADGSVIVERGTGARFVMKAGVLYPARNYASAVLFSGQTGPVSVAIVSHDDLEGIERGPLIGAEGLPDSLPEAEDLSRGPVAVCSQTAADGEVDVVVDVGAAAPMTGIEEQEAAYVESFRDVEYLLVGGRRHLIDNDQIVSQLDITEQPVKVGSAFLTAVPEGKPLAAPEITDVGRASDFPGLKVGQLIDANGQTWAVLSDGVALLNDMQAALLGTLGVGDKVSLSAEEFSEISGEKSSQGDLELDRLTEGLPDYVPAIAGEVDATGGACAIYRDGDELPTLAVLDGEGSSTEATGESKRSADGVADEVRMRPGVALVVTTADASAVHLIAEPGERFVAANLTVLGGFGYAEIEPVELPEELLQVIPDGPALDRDAL